MSNWELSQYFGYLPKEKKAAKKFVETKKYGSLHLDEYHGYFAICSPKDIDKNGKLKRDIGDVYPCTALQYINLDITPGSNFEQNFSGSLHLKCQMTNPTIGIDTVVQQTVHFVTQREGDHILYHEPGSLTMFRQAFAELIDLSAKQAAVKKAEKLKKQQREIQWSNLSIAEQNRLKAEWVKEQAKMQKKSADVKPDVKLSALEEAESAFMLDGKYTEEDIRRQRNVLLKAFHPDAGNVDDDKYTEKIMEYYKVLENHLGKDRK